MSSAENASQIVMQHAPLDKRIAIIGSGPVGVRFAHEMLKLHPSASVQLFGNEPFQPYNRVQLSAVLAGDVDRDDIFLALPDSDSFPNFQFVISVIKHINTTLKSITDANGETHRFDILVLATGARAHIPNIKGVNQSGVYTFRNLKDADFLYARLASARHVVVMGGGLLGIEAAKGLSRFNTKVTLVQQGPRLMNRQLDDEAAEYLQEEVERCGIRVIVNAGVRKIFGEHKVTGILTHGGEKIDCDTVLLCAGITPNVELARESGLAVRKGIVVDDHLCTSIPDIYAIGECCEHRGQTYGVVAPGYEQAAVAASVIAGDDSQYASTLVVSRLKVIDKAVCSIGQVVDLQDSPLQREYVYRNSEEAVYRRLIFNRRRLVGVISIGDWPELSRIQEVYTSQRPIGFLQVLRFKRCGYLWSDGGDARISDWPSAAVVCQCNNVTQGELLSSLAEKCEGLEKLQAETGAGTVCGSCKPLLANLISEYSATPIVAIKEWGWVALLLTSLAAFLVAGAQLTLPEAQTASSVLEQGWFEKIWNDKLWKQVTGFTLLGMTAIGLLMSLRKRFNLPWMGQLNAWRLSHAILGVICAVALILHTGLHLGVNLNFMLMTNFLVVLFIGGFTGLAVALSHRVNPLRAQKLRMACNRVHIAVSWPLPALLISHIVSVYYF